MLFFFFFYFSGCFSCFSRFTQLALEMFAELADETSAINTTNTNGVKCVTIVFSLEEHIKLKLLKCLVNIRKKYMQQAG